jgi:5-(carboxyamino)imidazole ribonucleotide synthase
VTALWPGATIGVVGGGQLARMLALEARRMGYRVAVLDPEPDCPAAQVSDHHVIGALDDSEAGKLLAMQCDVVTLDTEHFSHVALERIARITPVRPAPGVLRIVQDRLEQRRFLDEQRAAQVRYVPVGSSQGLREAAQLVGLPAVLKTRHSGYDGKGQLRVDRPEQHSGCRGTRSDNSP